MRQWSAVAPRSHHIKKFLIPQEWRAVAISDWIRTQRTWRARQPGYLRCWREQRQIIALLLHTANGLLYPLGYANQRTSVIPRLRSDLRFPRWAVVGHPQDVALLLKDLASASDFKYLITHRFSYRYYSYPYHTVPPTPNQHDLTVRPATWQDKKQLVALHTLYLREEVYQNSDMGHNYIVREVAYMLRERATMVALYRDQIVAKASTNGRGFLYDQIGGVYTLPNFRNRQIARTVLTALMAQLLLQGRKICLFVKERNHTARHLYHEMGFEEREPLVTITLGRGAHSTTAQFVEKNSSSYRHIE